MGEILAGSGEDTNRAGRRDLAPAVFYLCRFCGRFVKRPYGLCITVRSARNPTVLGRMKLRLRHYPFVCFADISPIRGIFIRPYGLHTTVGFV